MWDKAEQIKFDEFIWKNKTKIKSEERECIKMKDETDAIHWKDQRAPSIHSECQNPAERQSPAHIIRKVD